MAHDNDQQAHQDEQKAHQYDCIVCGSHFENSKDLTRHNESAHLSTATGTERPRTDTGDPTVADGYKQDRNPRQGFEDPRTDSSRNT
jgi:uncharacterized C2H2 Zn-finger protein